MIRKAVFRGLALLPLAASTGALVWTLQQSPFAAPFVDRTIEETGRAIERALARQVTPEWLAGEMALALDQDDWDRVQTLVLIGEDAGLAPAPETAERILALEAKATGFLAQSRDCLTCIADVADCPSLSALAACGVPFEMTPLGDINALRRAGMAAMSGEEIDKIDVTLALAGLGATVVVIVSGGTSYTAKVGTSVVRIGRKLGVLSPRFMRVLGDMSDVGLKSDKILPYALGRVPLDDVLDTARLGRLQGLGADITRVYHNTGSLTDSITLLRHVDNAEDAARLARASEILGPRTARTAEVLGKGRLFRAMVRLSDLAIGAIALICVVVLQVAGLLGHLLGNRIVVRPLARRFWSQSNR